MPRFIDKHTGIAKLRPSREKSLSTLTKRETIQRYRYA